MTQGTTDAEGLILGKHVADFSGLTVHLPERQEAYAAGEAGEVLLRAMRGGVLVWSLGLRAVPSEAPWLGRFGHAWEEDDSLLVLTHGEAPRGGTNHGQRLHRVAADGQLVWTQDVPALGVGSLVAGAWLFVISVHAPLRAEHGLVSLSVLSLDWEMGALGSRRAFLLRPDQPLGAGAMSHRVVPVALADGVLEVEVRGATRNGRRRRKWSFTRGLRLQAGVSYRPPSAHHYSLREQERRRLNEFLSVSRVLVGPYLDRERIPNWRLRRRYESAGVRRALLRHAREALLEVDLDAEDTITGWRLFEGPAAALKWSQDGLFFDAASRAGLRDAFPSDRSASDVIFDFGRRPTAECAFGEEQGYWVPDCGWVLIAKDGSARVVEGREAWEMRYA